MSLALWMGFLGGVVSNSDPLEKIAPERLTLWRFYNRRHNLNPRGCFPQGEIQIALK